MNVLGEKKEIFKPYQFKMEEIEGFRYRAQVSEIQCNKFIPRFRCAYQSILDFMFSWGLVMNPISSMSANASGSRLVLTLFHYNNNNTLFKYMIRI